MWAGGTDAAGYLALHDRVADGDVDLVKVAMDRRDRVAMVERDRAAGIEQVRFGQAHLTVSRCLYRRVEADRDFVKRVSGTY